TILSREQSCKGADNSWANWFLAPLMSGAVPLTVTNGSATVTGTNIPAGTCFGIASGTVTVTNGSAFITGAGLVDGAAITIVGTKNSGAAPVIVRFEFTQSGGTSGTLSAYWPGDSGTFSYVIENSGLMSTIGQSNDDVMLKENWACTWVDSSHITLNRPWDGSSGTGYYMRQNNISGFG